MRDGVVLTGGRLPQGYTVIKGTELDLNQLWSLLLIRANFRLSK